MKRESKPSSSARCANCRTRLGFLISSGASRYEGRKTPIFKADSSPNDSSLRGQKEIDFRKLAWCWTRVKRSPTMRPTTGKMAAQKKLIPILSDVARRARVSSTTASRVLNPDSQHPVKEATRRRVVRVAASLGYRPNPMARALRNPRQPTFSILVHDVSDIYYTMSNQL